MEDLKNIEPIDGRVKNGGARPGSGRKSYAEKLKKTEVKEQLVILEADFWVRMAQDKAIPVLEKNMAMGIGDTAVRSAIQVLDRAFGKVKEKHEITGKDGGALIVSWQDADSPDSV